MFQRAKRPISCFVSSCLSGCREPRYRSTVAAYRCWAAGCVLPSTFGLDGRSQPRATRSRAGRAWVGFPPSLCNCASKMKVAAATRARSATKPRLNLRWPFQIDLRRAKLRGRRIADLRAATRRALATTAGRPAAVGVCRPPAAQCPAPRAGDAAALLSRRHTMVRCHYPGIPRPAGNAGLHRLGALDGRCDRPGWSWSMMPPMTPHSPLPWKNLPRTSASPCSTIPRTRVSWPRSSAVWLCILPMMPCCSTRTPRSSEIGCCGCARPPTAQPMSGPSLR